MAGLKGRRDIWMSRKRGEDRKGGKGENDGGEGRLEKISTNIDTKRNGNNRESSAALIWNVVPSLMTRRSFWSTKGSV